MSDAPWLSVVVPVYNGETHLAAALESVLAQADDGVEVVVSDDGSTDRSGELIGRYRDDRRVVVLRGPACGNWVANSNLAVRRASAPLVTFLHQDDAWLPGRIDAVRRAATCTFQCAFWIGPSRFAGPDGRDLGPWNLPFGKDATSIDAQALLERLLVQNFVAMPAPIFTRADFERVGGMDECLWFTADWDLWLKLGALGGANVFPRATTAFRIHRQSQTMTNARTGDTMRQQIDAVRDRHLYRIEAPLTRDEVERAGRLSAAVNAVLAAASLGRMASPVKVMAALRDARGSGLRRFLRDARLRERVQSRLCLTLRG